MAEDGNASIWQEAPANIELAWRAAGGNAEHGLLMTAIAISQSGGWITAENVAGRSTHDLSFKPAYTTYSPTKDYSIGLWQLNFYRSLGPPRARRWADLVNGPYADAPTQFAQWLRTHEDAQVKIALDLYDAGRGLSNWTGDPAYEAWLKGGDQALAHWIGQDLIDTYGKGHKGKKPPPPPPGPKGPTGGGHKPKPKAPKSVVQPWNDLWRNTNKNGNEAIHAAKALKQRLVSAVGG